MDLYSGNLEKLFNVEIYFLLIENSFRLLELIREMPFTVLEQ